MWDFFASLKRFASLKQITKNLLKTKRNHQKKD